MTLSTKKKGKAAVLKAAPSYSFGTKQASRNEGKDGYVLLGLFVFLNPDQLPSKLNRKLEVYAKTILPLNLIDWSVHQCSSIEEDHPSKDHPLQYTLNWQSFRSFHSTHKPQWETTLTHSNPL